MDMWREEKLEVRPCGYVTQEGYKGRDRNGKWQEYATESEYREEFEEVLRKEQEKYGKTIKGGDVVG